MNRSPTDERNTHARGKDAGRLFPRSPLPAAGSGRDPGPHRPRFRRESNRNRSAPRQDPAGVGRAARRERWPSRTHPENLLAGLRLRVEETATAILMGAIAMQPPEMVGDIVT